MGIIDNKFNSLHDFIKYVDTSIKDATELEKIRFIYIAILSNDFAFDLDYSSGNNKTKKIIYNNSLFSEKVFDNIFKNKIIICKSISYIFEYICTYFGLNVKTERVNANPKEPGHVYNIVELKDKTIFMVDLQEDLENVQAHCRTKYFGLDLNHKYGIIDKETLEAIDIKIKYITLNCMYNDDYLIFLKRAMKTNALLEDKMELFFSCLDVCCQTFDMQYYQRKWFYKTKLDEYLTLAERKKVMIIDSFKKTNKEKNYYLIFLIILKDNLHKFYIFDENTKEFREMFDTEFNDKLGEGLITFQKIPAYIFKKTK